MTDTELRNLQADLVALKRAAEFFFGLIVAAAMSCAVYWSWYAIIPAAAVAFVYGRSLNDILWPEQVTQRAERRNARRQARAERLEARQPVRLAFNARHAKLLAWLAWLTLRHPRTDLSRRHPLLSGIGLLIGGMAWIVVALFVLSIITIVVLGIR